MPPRRFWTPAASGIDRYGWLDLEKMDPDYLGYVMWVQVPPYDHDVMNWQHNIPPRRAPTDQEQSLMERGHDFFGFMKTSRHFIGQVLIYEPHALPMEIESDEFDFSEFAALVALIAASDRLRDFLITAVLGQKNRDKPKDQLDTSLVQLEGAGFGALVAELRAGFAASESARAARNNAVHGLSTIPARVQSDILTRDRRAFEAQSWDRPESRSYDEQKEAWGQRVAAVKAAMAARAQLLCDTYLALIKVGEVSIRAEYNFRKRGGFAELT
jgi:hypothetical protein